MPEEEKKQSASPSGEAGKGLGILLLEGEDMIEQVTAAHSAAWGLGTADRWSLDQRTGLITWTFPDRTVTAEAQILASFNPAEGSWLWAWADEGVLPAMSRDSRLVRDWAREHGHDSLTIGKVDADKSSADTLAALAVRITRATGFYHPMNHAAIPIITFRPVTITASDGKRSTFSIDIG